MSITKPLRALAAAACLGGVAAAGCASIPAEDADRVAALEVRIAALNAQAQELEDIESVKRLQRAWAFYIDKGYWNEAADLFAEDATFETGVDGVYVGQDSIRQLIIEQGGGHDRPGLPFGQYNHHMHLQPVVHIAEDGLSAHARWREFGMTGQYQEDAFWEDGVFENTYVKENGLWKIASVRYFPNFVAPYEGGWPALEPVADATSWVSEVAERLPADAPPTGTYRPFPDVYVPPFHYDRAEVGVTGEGPITSAPVVRSDEMAGVEAVVANEEQALARLRSAHAIETLQNAYGYYIDKGLWTEASELFSEDATYEFGQSGVYVGRDRVRAAHELMGPEGLETGRLNNYPMLQPVIVVSADNATATARWRSDVQLSADGKGRWGAGLYENEYVNENGVWKIAKLHYYVTMWADYEQGWANGAALPMDGPSATLPPDQPPSEVYGSLPEVYLPPYSFSHPVTGEPHPGSGLRPEWDAEASSPGPVIIGSTIVLSGSRSLRGLEADALSLSARVERLEDSNAVQDLQRIYGYYVDKSQYYDVADLFADDATLEIGGRGVYVGRARIFDYVGSLGPTMAPRQGIMFNHQQFQPIVTISSDGQTAYGRLQALVMAISQWGDVTYENDYVKEDGVWKIEAIRARFNMYAQYDGSWSHAAEPLNRPEQGSRRPDFPPTITTLNYPNYFIEPFHYVNPVTGEAAPPPDPASGGMAFGDETNDAISRTAVTDYFTNGSLP